MTPNEQSGFIEECERGEPDLYYLQNVQAGYVGNNPMFWAKGGNGYTSYIDKAELFDARRAAAMLKEDSRKWKAWPATTVHCCTYRTVESQELNRHKPETFINAEGTVTR